MVEAVLLLVAGGRMPPGLVVAAGVPPALPGVATVFWLGVVVGFWLGVVVVLWLGFTMVLWLGVWPGVVVCVGEVAVAGTPPMPLVAAPPELVCAGATLERRIIASGIKSLFIRHLPGVGGPFTLFSFI